MNLKRESLDDYVDEQINNRNENWEAIESHLNDFATYLDSELGEEHIIRILPNGTKDEINLAQGKVIIRTKEKALQATDIDRITSATTVDYVWIKKPDDFAFHGRVAQDGNSAFILEGYTNFSGGEYDDANKVGQVASSSQVNNFFLITAKGAYATLQEAQTALAGQQLIYQLAEPVEIPLPDPMTPNTREIVRLSEQVDKLTAAIIAMGGTIV